MRQKDGRLKGGDVKDKSAFPGLREPRINESFPSWMSFFKPGMTLRQWYAGMALQGLAANIEFSLEAANAERMASSAFDLADSMLAFENSEKK